MTQEPIQEPMTILSLTVDSYQRMKAAKLTPSPTGLVLVRGKMANGKSSLIESIMETLDVHKSALPITEGEHGAEVGIDLGELSIRKTWKRDSGGVAKAGLSIKTRDGVPQKSPAKLLKSLRGHFADPVAFLDMKPADQVKTVLRVLGLADELQKLEDTHEAWYDKRRDVGRDVTRTKQALAAIREEVDGLPEIATRGTVAELTEELQVIEKSNATRAQYLQAQATANVRGKEASDRLKLLKSEVQKLEGEIAEQRQAWDQCKDYLIANADIATAPVVEEITAHEEASKQQGRRDLLAETERQHALAWEEHQEADQGVAGTRKLIDTLLDGAEFPIEGMGYDSSAKVITVGGMPFAQASQGQRLMIAAGVAMAGNPMIRVVFARQGSLLDDETRMELAKIVKARKFQLWLEVVDSDPEGAGIWIEDGYASDFVEGE